MPLRVIEIIAPRDDKEAVLDSLEEHRPDECYVFWSVPVEDDKAVSFRLVLQVQESENVLDKLESLFTWSEDYRIVVYPAEATLPRLEQKEQEIINDSEEGEESSEKDDDQSAKRLERISREELYTDVTDSSLMTWSYLVLVSMAAIVAVIGLMRDNVAIIIGAMVLAPLLGPNVGLSLATTLADGTLARQSLRTLLAGIFLVLLLSAACGFLFGAPEASQQLLSRAHTTYSDIALAMVSGCAGIVSVTLGTSTAMVGVMVALSLLPPLAACGLSLGAGQTGPATGAGMLFLTNIICLNLTGVVTFLVQGIQPLTWWERKKARSIVRRVGALWGALLALLCLLLYFKIVQ